MTICSQCGSDVPEGAVYCGKCGATQNPDILHSSVVMSTDSQSGTSQELASVKPISEISREMSMRLNKAIRRTELLSYTAAVLVVIILILLFLPAL